MEIQIIQTLRWHLNPPTPSMYLDVINPLIDAIVVDLQASYELLELARYLLELGVCDSYFVDKSPSSVAYASILVAIENLPKHVGSRFGSYQLDESPEVTELCAQRLRHVYILTTSPDQEEEEEYSGAAASPTSVLPE